MHGQLNTWIFEWNVHTAYDILPYLSSSAKNHSLNQWHEQDIYGDGIWINYYKSI